MAVAACREALQQGGLTVDDVRRGIVACSNLQRAYPAVSIEVQGALGVFSRVLLTILMWPCSSARLGLQAAGEIQVENGNCPAVAGG